jgi:two-component system CheB/CheR fusion protein
LLTLIEQRHGVGMRAGHLPSWVEVRLDRVLDGLEMSAGGDLQVAVERLSQEPGRLAELAEILRVGETCFYRDPPSWDALRKVALRRWAGDERIRAVSVGCSTGEEAWTLAMLVDEACRVGTRKRDWRVVGQERSEAALATAREGLYPSSGARHLPGDLGARYLAAEGEAVRVASELGERVSFVQRDLMQGLPPGRYELVVCKNVLIYFGAEAGRRAVDLLLRGLADDGMLVVARSEVPRLRAMGHRGEEIAPGVTVFGATARER